MRLRVEEPQANAFAVPRRAASFELEKARAPSPEFTDYKSAAVESRCVNR